MRTKTPRPATWFAPSTETGQQFLAHLALLGHGFTIDGDRFPRVTVPSLSQAALNELWDCFDRQRAAEERARERRERTP